MIVLFINTRESKINFKSLANLLKAFNTEEKCCGFFVSQRWSKGVVCPHCNNHESDKKIYKLATNEYYKCGACGKKFTVRIGTILGDSKISYQKWLVALYLVTNHKKGVSSLQLSKDIGVTQKTAWFMLQRILHVASTDNAKLSGTVEIDKTYVGGKESNKHASRKTSEYNKIQGDKAMFIGMIERGGNLILKKFDKLNKANLEPIMNKYVQENAVVNTDESAIYKGALSNRERKIVNHSKAVYSFNDVTTNRIEGVLSHFKRMVYGIHHSLSKAHIQRYANMFCFRWNTSDSDGQSRINILLSGIESTRITYRMVIA